MVAGLYKFKNCLKQNTCEKGKLWDLRKQANT